MKKKFNLNFILILIGVVFLYIFPVFKDYYLLNVFSIAVIYAVYAASWDFLSGFTGKENFGHAAFIAIGGYMIGFISSVYPIKPFLSIPLAAVVSAIFGILIGLPTLKLKGPYFALATLAVATIFEKLSISLSDLTGGEEGIYGIEFLTQGQISSFYFVLTFAVLAILIMYILGKSNFGLILKSLRSDEDAARALGIKINFYKISAFAVSSMFAGIAGSIVAHFYGYIGPDIVYPLSLNSIIMAVVGGIGGIVPAALGGFFLTFISEMLSEFGDWNQLLYTVVLILSTLFLPSGIFNYLGAKIRTIGSKAGEK